MKRASIISIGDELLQGLITDRVAEPAMHRLHGLPLAVVEQALEILRGCRALGVATEAARELVGKLTEPPQERTRRPIRHARKRTKLSKIVQVRNLGSSCTKHWI